MRNLLACLAVLVISFALACHYRGWCSIEPLPADLGKSAFRVEIDRVRIARDVMDGARAIQRALVTEPRSEEGQDPTKDSEKSLDRTTSTGKESETKIQP